MNQLSYVLGIVAGVSVGSSSIVREPCGNASVWPPAITEDDRMGFEPPGLGRMAPAPMGRDHVQYVQTLLAMSTTYACALGRDHTNQMRCVSSSTLIARSTSSCAPNV